MSYLPTPVSESTAAEIVRREGSAKGFTTNDTITQSDIVKLANGSGLVRAVNGDLLPIIDGVAIYTAVSGARTVAIKGRVRAVWDGVGTVVPGTVLGVSAARSGWFEPSASTSGQLQIGYYRGTAALAAANSGTAVEVELL